MAVGVVVAATLLALWWNLQPAIGSDPLTYVIKARFYPEITPGHHGFRLGLLLPLWALVQVFGVSEATYVVAGWGGTLLLVVGTYALGHVLYGRVVGVVAALLLLTTPTVLDAANERVLGWVLPDPPSAGLVALAFAALVVAVRDRPAGATAQRRWLLLAGLLLGGAYLVREYTVFFALAVPLVFWVHRARLTLVPIVATPMVLLFALESAVHWVVWGAPFVRVLDAAGHGSVPDPDKRLVTISDALTRFLQATVLRNPVGSLVLLAGLALTVVGALWLRDRSARVGAAMFVALWVPITLLSGVLTPGRHSLTSYNPRYWLGVLPVLIVVAVGVPALVTRRAAERRGAGLLTLARVSVAIVAVAGIASAVAGFGAAADTRSYGHEWHELRAWLATNGDEHERLFTDPWAARSVEYVYAKRPLDGQLLWDGDIVGDDLPLRRGITLEEVEAAGGGVWLESPYRRGPRPDPDTGEVVFRSSAGTLQVSAYPPG